MSIFYKGSDNEPINNISAIRYITEQPESFIGVTTDRKAVYDYHAMLWEVFGEHSHLVSYDASEELDQMLAWCNKKVIQIINQYELLLNHDDDILIIRPCCIAAHLCRDRSEVEFAEFDLLRTYSR